MGYISFPSDLDAIKGIKSYYCVILKMVMLHDAIKTIQRSVFAFFPKKRTNTCFNKSLRSTVVKVKTTSTFQPSNSRLSSGQIATRVGKH